LKLYFGYIYIVNNNNNIIIWKITTIYCFIAKTMIIICIVDILYPKNLTIPMLNEMLIKVLATVFVLDYEKRKIHMYIIHTIS